MSLRETLLANDFTDNGQCHICGGTAWLYTKVVNRSQCTVKVRLTQAAMRLPLNERKFHESGTGTFKYKTYTIPLTHMTDLQKILENYGCAKTVSA